MGVSGAGVAFICLSVLLFIIGILLCLYGYKKSREANRLGAEYKQTYDQRVQNHRVQGRPGASPWAPYEPSPFSPPPPVGAPPMDPAAAAASGGGVVGVAQHEGGDRSGTAVETDTGILRDGRQLANVMEEQTRLERDIHRLENEQWALDNKWEGVVKVSQMTGEQHEVEFVSTDTLSALKMRLYDLTGVIPQRIVLSFAGKLLVPDTYMLGAFRVPENPTLFMVATAGDPDAPALAPPAGPANSEMKALQTKEATLQFRKDAGEDVAAEEEALQEERRALEARLGSSAANPAAAAAAAAPSVAQQRPGESDEAFQARRLQEEREAYRAQEGAAAGAAAAPAAGTESVPAVAAAAAAAPAASAAEQQQEQQAQQEQQQQQQPQPASS